MHDATFFHYRVHGVTLASEFEFPGLPLTTAPAEVIVRRGSTPDHLEPPCISGVLFEARPRSYLLKVPGTASYWVRDGREVTIDADPSSAAADIVAFIAGPVLTALLQQRGALVLHAAAVAGSGAAILIAGQSGNGKSTLLAALAARGIGVMCDDAAAVTLDAAGTPVVHPGVPQARLWKDAVRHLGENPAALVRARKGIEKFVLPLHHRFVGEARPIAALYVLGLGNQQDLSVSRIADAECFDVLRAQTRNLRVLDGLRMHATHFRLAAALASRVPLYRVARPQGRNTIAELADLVQEGLP